MKDANDNDGQKRVSITNECGNIVNRIEQDLIKFENDNKNDNYEQIKIRNHSINNNSELTKEKDLIAQNPKHSQRSLSFFQHLTSSEISKKSFPSQNSEKFF